MEVNKNYNLLYLGMVFILVVAVIGVSYAMYTFTGTGTTENVITTGQISVAFAEQNNIKIQNRYPETDIEGLANIDSNSSMTFTVSGNIVGDTTVNYAVGLVDIVEGATLKQDYIKIYLTKNGEVANNFTENKGRTIKSFESSYVTDFLNSHAIAQGSVTGIQTDTYTLKAWISEDYNLPTTNTGSGNVHSNTTTSETFSFKIKAVGTAGILEIDSPALDNSGANEPELARNMIPVYYNNGNWVKADSNNKDTVNKWYDYNDKMWANAVTVTNANRETYLNASAGTPIPMEDINTMWVWIPRFSATGDTENYNGGTIDNPGAFNITFVDEETSAHDAFTFGNDSLTGFWMGKFEITGDVSNECTNEFCDISDVTILPNNYSLVNKIVSNYFYIGRNMEKSGNQYGFDKTIDTTLDTHMIKNSEWGAVVYLTQSIYGRCTSPTSCSEVEVNSYGSGAGMPEPTSNISEINNYNASFLAVSDSCDKSKNVTGECDYEGNLNQSTTGNIYGVYDMSGGAEEYVMGMLSMDSPKDYSGFSSSTSTSSFDLLPEEKYYNYYNKESLIELQHATDETENWYVDFYGYYSGFFWYLRGYRYFNISSAGIFAYSFSDGQGRSYIGSRLIIAN